MTFAAHSSLHYQLAAGRGAPLVPDASTLRAEEPGLPTAADILKPGMIITTSYGTGPYLVHAVIPVISYGEWRSVSITLIPETPGKGFVARAHSYYAVNEIVASYEDATPRLLKLFRASPDEIFIVDERGVREDRSGQMLLF